MTAIDGTASTNEGLVRHYFTCLDSEDWVAMRDLWHEDSTLRAVGARQRRGVDEVIGYFSKLFTPWAKHEDRPTRLLISGDAIVAEVTFYGTTGDGREVAFEAIDVFDLAGGRISRFSNWYDLDYARKALSVRNE
jgi:ketosteroid isomerase-like protein